MKQKFDDNVHNKLTMLPQRRKKKWYLDKTNPFKNIGTEDIWIEDDLFGDDDSPVVKDVSKDIIDRADDLICNFPTVTDDNETIDDTIETIIVYDGIQIPEEDGIVVDTGVPRKVKIISSHANRINSCW